MFRSTLSGTVALAIVAAVATLGGCGRATRMAVPIQGMPVATQYPTNVEVTNWNGSVHIYSDTKAKAASVSAKVRTRDKDLWKKEGDLLATADVKAVSTVGPNGRVLTVTAQPATQPPKDIAVDLYIRVPKVASTKVRNAGGQVEVVRSEGSVDVVNGAGGGPGGDILVRTGAAMTEPSSLTTSSGLVIYQVGPGSTGRFDMSSGKGPTPQFLSRFGEVNDVRPDFQRYTCVFNKGGNPVVLRSGDGLVRATVLADAGEYVPDVTDTWTIDWPKNPRWVGRLGGYYNDEPALTHFRQRAKEASERAGETPAPPQ